MSTTVPGARKRRWHGAHLSVGEVTRTEVPATHGIAAHIDYSVRTACGREVSTTLTTRRPDLARCPDCKAANGDD